MISAIFIMNSKGQVLISRIFRDVTIKAAQEFNLNVIASPDEGKSPVRTYGNLSYLYIKDEELYLFAVTKANVDACVVFEILYQIIRDMKLNYGKFNENFIKNHYVVIYQLLDEICDFGYVQANVTEALKLQGVIKGNKSNEKQLTQIRKKLGDITGAISWRDPGLKYKKNEIFIDVVESVNLLMSPQGNILRSDVDGKILIKTQLSGMPECRLGMNDKLRLQREESRGADRFANKGAMDSIEIDDCTFHQCVKLQKFETERTISFVPPDGEFQLLKYRTTENINIPFRITPIVNEIANTRVEFQVACRSTFKRRLWATGVTIKIPVPNNTATKKIKVTGGRAKYVPSEGAIVWRVNRFPGETEYKLSAQIGLMATVAEKQPWSRPPIQMEFQVPMFSSSNLLIRFLKVFEPKQRYQAIKWIRYLSKQGQYLNRI